MKDKKSEVPSIDAFKKEVEDKSIDFAKKLPVFGHVMWLFTQSAPHKYYLIQDIESRVLTPILGEQCKLYMQTKTVGIPMAFVSWAFLSKEAEKRYIQTLRLAPSDWRSGENLWIIDVVCPFGGSEKIIGELYHTIFKDQSIYLLLPGKDGGLVKTTIQDIVKSPTKNKDEQEKKKSIN